MKEQATRVRRVVVAALAVLVVAGPAAWAILRARSRSSDEAERLLRHASEAAAASATKRPLTSRNVDVSGSLSSGQTAEVRIGRLTDGSGNVVGYAPRLDSPLDEGDNVNLQLPDGGTIVIAPAQSGATQKWPATDAQR